MKHFYYKAKAGPAQCQEGVIDAIDQESAAMKIANLGLMPIKIIETIEKQKIAEKKIFWLKGVFKKKALGDIINFFSQLNDLLQAEIEVLHALEILEKQTKSQIQQELIRQIKGQVKDGASLSKALATRPDQFPGYVTAIIEAGELSGQLPVIVNRLCRMLEEQKELSSRFIMSLIYPGIIAGVGISTILILLTFVIPRLAGMFDDTGMKMPFLTRILIASSDFLKNDWFIFLGVGTALFLWFVRERQTSTGKYKIDQWLLKCPWLGKFIYIAQAQRLAQIMGIMLESGVDLIPALNCSQRIVDNKVLQAEVENIKERILKGDSLAEAFSQSQLFQGAVVTMIRVGEESGYSYKGFMKWAQAFEREFQQMSKVMTTLLEPILILLIGVIVGLIVMALLLPIFNMNVMVETS